MNQKFVLFYTSLLLVGCLSPIQVDGEPLFFKSQTKNRPNSGGNKYFWDVFGIFGQKNKTPSSSYNSITSSYGAPSSSYGAPSSGYGAPSTNYGAPSSGYGAPGSAPSYKPSYEPPGASKPTYEAQRPVNPSYSPPVVPSLPTYQTPGQSYQPPGSTKPSYEAPKPTYAPSKPSYNPPGSSKPSYQPSVATPNSLYEPLGSTHSSYFPPSASNPNPSYLPPGTKKPTYLPSYVPGQTGRPSHVPTSISSYQPTTFRPSWPTKPSVSGSSDSFDSLPEYQTSNNHFGSQSNQFSSGNQFGSQFESSTFQHGTGSQTSFQETQFGSQGQFSGNGGFQQVHGGFPGPGFHPPQSLVPCDCTQQFPTAFPVTVHPPQQTQHTQQPQQPLQPQQQPLQPQQPQHPNQPNQPQHTQQPQHPQQPQPGIVQQQQPGGQGTYFPTLPEITMQQSQPPIYRPQLTEIFEFPQTQAPQLPPTYSTTTTSTTAALTTQTTQSSTIITTEINVSESSETADVESVTDEINAEKITWPLESQQAGSNKTGRGEEFSRLEDPKAEPGSSTGDGWVPMTLQRVMEIVIGKDSQTQREDLSTNFNKFERQRQQNQRQPKANSRPNASPVFRGNEIPQPQNVVRQQNFQQENKPDALPDFRQPRTGARHMKLDKARLNSLDFKVSDAEVTTVKNKPPLRQNGSEGQNLEQNHTVRFPEDANIDPGLLENGNKSEKLKLNQKSIFVHENPGNGSVLIVHGQTVPPEEVDRMNKRRLEIQSKEKLRELEENKKKNQFLGGKFDHGLNTLATLANSDLDFLPTTESSGSSEDHRQDVAIRSTTETNQQNKNTVTFNIDKADTFKKQYADTLNSEVPSKKTNTNRDGIDKNVDFSFKTVLGNTDILSTSTEKIPDHAFKSSTTENTREFTEKVVDQSRQTEPPISTHQTILNLLGNNDTNWVWKLADDIGHNANTNSTINSENYSDTNSDNYEYEDEDEEGTDDGFEQNTEPLEIPDQNQQPLFETLSNNFKSTQTDPTQTPPLLTPSTQTDSRFSTSNLPTNSPHLTPDFVLLSDAWFANDSVTNATTSHLLTPEAPTTHLPKISPTNVEFYLDPADSDGHNEMIDLTTNTDGNNNNSNKVIINSKNNLNNSNENDNNKNNNNNNKGFISNINGKNKEEATNQEDRQPKALKDNDLVVYLPIQGEPFLSFPPHIEFASIVNTVKK